MKRILFLLISCLLVMSCIMWLTACSKNTSKPTEVKLWVTWDIEEGGSAHELKLIVDEYNKIQDEVKVVLERQPGDNFSQKLYMSVADGVGPDAVFSFANTLPEYVDDNLLCDMGKYIDEDALAARLSNNQLEECYGFSDGKLHIVPVQSTTTVLFYNKTLFDKLEIEVPATWDEVAAVSKTIYESEKIKGFSAESYTDLAQMLFMQTGCEYIDSKTKTVGFGTDACFSELTKYVENINNNYFTATYSTGSLADDFNSGNLAAFVGTCTYENYLSPDGFELGVACSPVGKVEWAPAFNRGIVVFKSNEKKERAMCDFVEYFTNKENSVRWCMSIDSLSPFNDATDIQEYRNYIQENKILIAASETMEYAYGTPAIIGASQVRTELKNMFLSIVGEQKSVQDAFNDAVSKCNSALKENRNDD